MELDLDIQELGLLVRVVSLARHAEVVLKYCTEVEQALLKQLAGKLDQVLRREEVSGDGAGSC